MDWFERRYDPEYARSKIDVAMIVDALERHVLGEMKMTASQVSAALALLKKVMPDLSSRRSSTTEQEQTETISHEDALEELD